MPRDPVLMAASPPAFSRASKIARTMSMASVRTGSFSWAMNSLSSASFRVMNAGQTPRAFFSSISATLIARPSFFRSRTFNGAPQRPSTAPLTRHSSAPQPSSAPMIICSLAPQ